MKCGGHFSVRQVDQDTLVSTPFQPPPRFRSPLAICLALAGLLVFLGGGAGLVIYCLNLPDDTTPLAENTANAGEINPPDPADNDDTRPQPGKDGKKAKEEKVSSQPAPGKEPANKGNKEIVTIDPTPPFVKIAKPAPLVPSPEDDWIPKAANAAIDRGVAFLRRHFGQIDRARWSHDEVHVAKTDPSGLLALTGLALLESGVPASDPVIVAAHRAILLWVGRVERTYDLGLSILFLDRLGKKQDEEIIERLALQLIVRQNPDGGWPYTCPPLSPSGGKELLRFLQDNRLTYRELAHPQEFLLAIPGQNGSRFLAPERKSGPALPAKSPPIQKISAPIKTGAQPRFRADQLPPALQHLPVVTQPKVTPPERNGARNRSDNSNTQFALLGLWIAQKHGIPMERTFNLVDQRFRQTQAPDGAWAYTPDYNPVPPAMTCAGLLGLAVGHGSAQQVLLGGEKARAPAGDGPSLTDPLIENGLRFVGQSIGQPVPNPNTYFFWSVERVAVLYHLDTIGGKDWYSWGARILIADQRADGSWFFNNIYSAQSPVVDTCFALLFLKKADFVPSLGRDLQQFIRVRDPEMR